MSDFFAELEEDIREERIFILWRKYGNVIIGIALAIILSTVGYTLWKYINHQNQLKRHVSFSQSVALLKHGKKDEALKAFEEIERQGGGYGKLAQLYKASLLPDPAPLYAKISKENARDLALSSLTKFLATERTLKTPEAGEALTSLAAPNSAWAPLSLELLALIDLRKGQDVKAAESYVQALKEPLLTPDEKARISIMLSQMDIPSSLLDAAGERP